MKITRNLRVALALTIGAALAGCGGGGDGRGGGSVGDGASGASSGSVPDSALQSSDAFIAYLKQLVATAMDNSEPIGVGSGQAPASNTAEAVNF